MSDTIKLPRLARDFAGSEIVITREAEKPMRLEFSLSSESPVDRWFGTEVLSHAEKAVDMSRASARAMPLLFNHDWNDPVGMVEVMRLEDGRTKCEAVMFATERAREVGQMVDGGLRNVSVGYEILEMTEDTKRNVFTATRWMPLEASIVTVPADITVGVGRSADDSAREVRVVRHPISQPAAPAAPKEKAAMAETQAAAGALAEDQSVKLSAVEMDKQRVKAIRDLVKANKLDTRIEERWIADGTPLTDIAGQILDVLEERGKTTAKSASELGFTTKEHQRYSLFRVMRMLSAQSGADTARFTNEAAFELECSRSVAKQLGRDPDGIFIPADILRRPIDPNEVRRVMGGTRAMTAQPGASGGYMVGVENMGFIDILRNRSVLSRMGARTLSGLVGNVTIPRQTGSATLAWQAGETTTATATDQTLGQLSLTPKTAIAVTEVGRTLMMQASPSAEGMITADLAKVVATGVDLAGINGAGGASPIGIINTAGITTGQDASTATYAKMLAFQAVAAEANAILGGAGYVTTPTVAAALMARSRFANTDTPLWDGNILDGTMCGFPAMSSKQIPTSNALFGSFEEVIIGEWGVLELTMNPYQSFNAGVVGIRAIYTVDVLTRYPQAFVLSTAAS